MSTEFALGHEIVLLPLPPFCRCEEEADPEPVACEAAGLFQAWCAEELARLSEQPRLVDVQRTKLFLLDRYFAWRVRVGDACRDHVVRDRHRCIFQVFEDAYLALDKVELVLHPPLTPPEGERPMVAVPGVMLGDAVYELDRPR